MTLKQIADELQLKETYLKAHWKRIQENYNKRGIWIVKKGRGDTAIYGIRSYEDEKLRW